METIIETKVGKISVMPDGIIRVDGNPDVHIEQKDMDENYAAFKTLVKGKDAPFLVIFGENASISREAREKFADWERSKIKRAEALVTPQLHHKLIARHHISSDKPEHPTKVFNNEAKALKWLKQFAGL